ncbi:MAG: GTPase ObgE [Firmicutes bacterium]|nr:GTPase ObgE [Bacillota bacterium]
MFIDEVSLELIAGTGGDGCLAFRREKFVEMGGPFGGNGGRGSDIIFKVDEGLNTLVDLRYQKQIKGKKGENGQGKGMHGKGADDVIIKVPLGTVVTDLDTGFILADLTCKDEEVIICKGGRGGRGNIAFATRSNPAPNFAENGEPGEERRVKVELKLLADVGLVGLPSVGKSTIISKISAAKPKIAAYHFTTLKPNLGVVKSKNSSFVVADLPGLIEGASQGDGLGDQFLKHIERTRIIAHIIDMGSTEGRDPYNDYLIINKELENFNPKIMEKPQIIIANKMDMPDAEENLRLFKEKVNADIYPIKAISGEGLSEVIEVLADMLSKIEKQPLYEEEKFESHVLYKFKEEQPFTITRDNNTWVVRGEKVEKLLKMTKFNTDDAANRFANKLRKFGVDDKLRELGAEAGDTVRILDFEFEYEE